MTDSLRVPAGVDVTVPSTARMYDYYLGGKNNFPADRKAAESVLSNVPWLGRTALENRAFLRRAVTYLTREVGIRQFIDIGAGLSAQGTVHEIAHAIAPETRVVYVDHDPLVVAYKSSCSNTLATRSSSRVTFVPLRGSSPTLALPRSSTGTGRSACC